MTEYSIELGNEGGQFTMNEDDDSILDAAEKHGFDLPYQCRMGHCGICAVHASGEVCQEDALMLTPNEKEEGYVLTCVATPQSDLTLNTNDTP